jgi:hypothetical protein
LRKKSKAELTSNGLVTVTVVVIVGATLSTPIFGWTPILVVSGGLLAAGWVLGQLDGGSRR